MDERASVKISLIQFVNSQVNLVSLHQNLYTQNVTPNENGSTINGIRMSGRFTGIQFFLLCNRYLQLHSRLVM